MGPRTLHLTVAAVVLTAAAPVERRTKQVRKAEDKAKAAAVRQKDLGETEVICKEFRQHDATIAEKTR